MKTLDRYVIREVVPPFLLALLIFTFILALPPLMEQLERLVAKGVPWRTAGQIILLLTPSALGLTIPMSLLVGLLIGLGRMSADRESVALLACGVSPYRVLRPVLAIAAVATAATLYVMVSLIPDSNQRYREIVFDIISKKVDSDVRPRVFYQDFPNWTVYPRDEPQPGVPGWKDVLVANTAKPDAVEIYMAQRGQIVLDRTRRTVDLVLRDGMHYAAAGARETKTASFTYHVLGLDPDSIFPPLEISRNIPEKTIAQLRDDIDRKTREGLSPHNEIMGIHAKFSIPAACLVFAVTALALGLTVARDGKLGGFVVGIGVIFAYYIAMFLAESMAKGSQLPAWSARWVPNVVLGLFGIAALIWRARQTEGRLPIIARLAQMPRPAWLRRASKRGAGASTTAASGHRARSTRRSGVVVVVRVPRLYSPAPRLIDRYITRLYMRVVGLSTLALLGLFYISTFIDRSDKIFKGQATTGMVGELLVWLTPQFVYFVIPIAALLSTLITFGMLARTSELTVLKACGVSLYRAAASVIVLSLAFSGVLFGLEQRVKATANRRADRLDSAIRGRQQAMTALDRRWVVGRDRSIYHYAFFDPQANDMSAVTIFKPQATRWALETKTFARRMVYRDGAWRATEGWVNDFRTQPSSSRPLSTAPIPDLEAPDYFATEQPLAEMMTVGELRSHISELSASGFNVVPLQVELQRKLAFPFVTFVMTLLAVPFGVTTGRRGALYGIGLGIVIALSYWTVFSAFLAIGSAGLLPPTLAAWTTNVLVLGLAGYLFLRAKT